MHTWMHRTSVDLRAYTRGYCADPHMDAQKTRVTTHVRIRTRVTTQCTELLEIYARGRDACIRGHRADPHKSYVRRFRL